MRIVVSLIVLWGFVLSSGCQTNSVDAETPIEITSSPNAASPSTSLPVSQPPGGAVAKPLPSPIPPEPLNPIIGGAATPTTVALPDSTVAPASAWQTYQSQAGGYTAEYPADWTVSEQVGTDGSSVTTFSAAGGTGIMVIVQSGEFGGAGSSDIPNTRCEQVTVGGMTGMRCLDTLNFATSTTVAANGQTFTIATLGKRMEEDIYSRFLSGFQIIK